MRNIYQHISFVFLGFLFAFLSVYCENTKVIDTIISNFIAISVGILGVNITVLGLLTTRIIDMSANYQIPTKTFKALKFTTHLNIILVGFSIPILWISELLLANQNFIIKIIGYTPVVSIFFYLFRIMYDISDSLLIILELFLKKTK